MAKCLICGAPHSSCGPSSTAVPVDLNVERKVPTVGNKRYPVTIRGTETVLLLSDEDAKKQGLDPAKDAEGSKRSAKAAKAPANKAAAAPANKAAAPASAPAAAPAAPKA